MGILDYMSQKYTDVKSYASGKIESAKSTIEGAVTDAKDITARALIPDKQPLLNMQQRGGVDANKYNIKQFTYPTDLLMPQYGGNYAVFYINVSDASRLFAQEESFELDPSTEKRLRGQLVANAEKLAESADKLIKKTVSAIPESVGKITVDAVKNAVPYNARSQRRLKTAVALHIPNQLSVRYATSWDEESMADATAALQAANAVGEAFSGNKGAVKKAIGDVAGVGLEYGAMKVLNNIPGGQAIQTAAGVAANPKKEQTFKGVEFRRFTFDYQFYPRDEGEATNVLNIIHQFKLHMHPEFKSELNYVWIYPSEFDIIYYTNGGENLNIHRHTSCVLEAMNVNYTPNGNFSVFANGMPTQINLSLEFKELQLLSKETVGKVPGGL